MIAASVLVALPTASAATSPPKNTSPPKISGTPQVGQKLTASTGNWSGKPTRYAYQWQRCNSSGTGCSPISGATTSSYTVTTSDVGNTLVVTVTASNAAGSSSASSPPTTVVQAAPTAPANTVPPTITGAATAGQLLSASTGSWNGTQPISYAYQWQRCNSSGTACSPISGATTSSYTATTSDVGNTLEVTVTASNSAGSSSASSALTAVVQAAPTAPINTGAPTVSGTPQAGQTLAAGIGTWNGTQPISYAYQWQHCNSSGTACSPISGATTSSYTATASDVGNTLEVTVTASNSAGSSSASSAPTAVVQAAPTAPTNTAPPTITGTAQDGQVLTAGSGSWNGTQPISYAYQWQRCDSSGNNCNPISGATSSAYTATSSDVGGTIEATVTATNSAGTSSATSTATATVQAAPPISTSAPTISGTAQDGQLLTASSGSWNGTQPISYAYQWQRCDSSGNNCNPISGATSSSYTATSSDVGNTLEVTVSASNSGGSATAVSAPTGVVAASSPASTTYYVDCQGSDSNNGRSPATAWATLTKADAATLAPGDSLLLKRGCTFTNTLTAKWNGTAESPIVIDAYGSGSNPLIQLDAHGTATSLVGVAVSGSYETIQDLQTRVINPYLNTSCLEPDGTGVPNGWYVGFDLEGSYNTLANLDASSASVGVAMDDTATHNRILNNHLHGMHDLWQVDEAHGAMGGMGIDLHGDSNELAYNLIEDNGVSCTFGDGGTNSYSAAFEVFNANDNYVHHNLAYGHHKQFEMGHDSSHTTNNNVLAYNLFYSSDPGAVGPNIHGGFSSYGPVNNTQIYNNTIVLTGSGSQALVCGCSGGAVVRNNILVATYKSAYYTGSIVESNNDYWNYTGSTVVQFSGATQSNISSTSKVANPIFVNATGDFDLQATSPDIDAGALISTTDPLLASLLGYDLNNKPVPSGGAPDIGAYEYQ